MVTVVDEKSERSDPFALCNRRVVKKIEATPSIVLAPTSSLAKTHRPEVDDHYGHPTDDEIDRAERIRNDLRRVITLHISARALGQLCLRVQEVNGLTGWINGSVSRAERVIENILAGGAAKHDSLDVIQTAINIVDCKAGVTI